jgi:hypothetical protein
MYSSDVASIIVGMEDGGLLHRIEDDLTETWVEDLASAGVDSIESYLAKHLAFLTFLDEA